MEYWENEVTKEYCLQFHSWKFILEKLKLIFTEELYT